MSRELSPLKALEKLTNYKCSCMSEKIECKEIIETALKEYEVSFNETIKITESETVLKKLKAFEIIKERDVDVSLLKDSPNLAHYNRRFDYSDYQKLTRQLTQEEYELLKEVF